MSAEAEAIGELLTNTVQTAHSIELTMMSHMEVFSRGYEALDLQTRVGCVEQLQAHLDDYLLAMQRFATAGMACKAVGIPESDLQGLQKKGAAAAHVQFEHDKDQIQAEFEEIMRGAAGDGG